jgi:tricorn protease
MHEVNHRKIPTGSQPEVCNVHVAGGRVDQVFTIPVDFLNGSKDGNTILYHDKKGGEDNWRKQHQ